MRRSTGARQGLHRDGDDEGGDQRAAGGGAGADVCASKRRRCSAASICKQDDIPHAIEWLERAAEAPAPGQAEADELLYELGSILEDAGETSRALAVFLELQADAGEYRDVAARVERLARVQTGS